MCVSDILWQSSRPRSHLTCQVMLWYLLVLIFFSLLRSSVCMAAYLHECVFVVAFCCPNSCVYGYLVFPVWPCFLSLMINSRHDLMDNSYRRVFQSFVCLSYLFVNIRRLHHQQPEKKSNLWSIFTALESKTHRVSLWDSTTCYQTLTMAFWVRSLVNKVIHRFNSIVWGFRPKQS